MSRSTRSSVTRTVTCSKSSSSNGSAPATPTAKTASTSAMPTMLAELGEIRDRCHTAEATSDRPFLFVPRRENRVINSTGRTLPGLMRGRSYNPAFMHPDDLSRLGVAAGDLVEIRSEYDAITSIAEADADLRPGVVSMSSQLRRQPGRGRGSPRRRSEHQPPAP